MLERPVRVIDIWLHSSLTLSGPTDSQYLLLSAERNNKPRSNPPMERVIEAMAIEKDRARETGRGGNSTFSTILFLIPFIFIFSILYFNKHLGNKKKTASRREKE